MRIWCAGKRCSIDDGGHRCVQGMVDPRRRICAEPPAHRPTHRVHPGAHTAGALRGAVPLFVPRLPHLHAAFSLWRSRCAHSWNLQYPVASPAALSETRPAALSATRPCPDGVPKGNRQSCDLRSHIRSIRVAWIGRASEDVSLGVSSSAWQRCKSSRSQICLEPKCMSQE